MDISTYITNNIITENVNEAITYDTKTELEYNKMYNDTLKSLGELNDINRLKAFKKVYDGKEFIGANGVTYKLKLNKKYTSANDMVKITASRGGVKQEMVIGALNIPFIIG